MDSVVQTCGHLTQEHIAFLDKIAGELGILADLCRADVLLFCQCAMERAVVVSQARPHSILPIYSDSLVGQQVGFSDKPHVLRALIEGRHGVAEVRRGDGVRGASRSAPIVQETYPIQTPEGHVVAAVSIETNLIERERHRRRSKVFQRALKQFQEVVLSGELQATDRLTPFNEHDGVLFVDAQHRIQYVSGIATSLYRKLGYADDLVGWHVEDLELDDCRLVLEALEEGRCLEGEAQVGGLIWLKQAIPLFSHGKALAPRSRRREPPRRLEGVLVTIHDETDRRRQDEELQVKVAMIQEIHHRVKNNMQTIASLLRLQSRRAESEETRRALQEGINRILSVAVIHEFLAHQEARVINIRDVSQRIINQIREGVLDDDQSIRLELRGPNVYLPTQPATVCALVINELLLNALEHGYERQERGTVSVNLHDDGEQIIISVDDDGIGLPEDFDLAQTGSLGLQIVQTLAQGDLKGHFELRGRDKGVSAVVAFPKHTRGGR